MAFIRAGRVTNIALPQLRTAILNQGCHQSTYTSGEEQAYRELIASRMHCTARPKLSFTTHTKTWTEEVLARRPELTPEEKILNKFVVVQTMSHIRIFEKRLNQFAQSISGMMISDALAVMGGQALKPCYIIHQALRRAQQAAPQKFAGPDKTCLYVHSISVSRSNRTRFILMHGRGFKGKGYIHYSNMRVELKVPIHKLANWRFNKPHKVAEEHHPLLHVPYRPSSSH